MNATHTNPFSPDSRTLDRHVADIVTIDDPAVSSATEYTLNVVGRELKVVCESSPQHMRAVEALLNEQVAACGGASGVPLPNAIMLAALNLADELVRERERHQALKEKIRSRSNMLLEKLEPPAAGVAS